MRSIPVRLGWRFVRHRPGTVFGVALLLAITVALVSAHTFVYHSADRQIQPVERFAGVPLVVAANHAEGHLSPETITNLAALPEVDRIVPEVSFPATLLDDDGAVVRVPDTVGSFGHGWGSAPLTPFTLVEGDAPDPGEVVLDLGSAREAGVGVGENVEVLSLGVVRGHRVSGLAEAEGARYQSALFFEDGRARALAGKPASVAGVFPVTEEESGRGTYRAVTAALNGTTALTLTGDDRGAAEGVVDVLAEREAGLNAANALVVVLVLGTGVVAGAMGLAVRGRGREIAVLRAMGATPAQIRLMVAGEAGALSLVAVLLGIPVGALLAGRLAPTPTYQVHHTLEAVLWAAVFVLLCSQVAGGIAAWHALRVRPSDAFAEAVAQGREPARWRSAVGALLLGCVFAMAWTMARFELGGSRGDLVALCLMLFGVVGAGSIAPRLLRDVARRTRPGGGVGRRPALARANVAFHHRRFAGACAAFLAGITLVGVAGTTQLYFNWTAGARGVEYVTSNLLVVAAEGDAFAEDALAAASNVPGVSAVAYDQEVRVEVEGEPEPVVANVPRGAAREALELGLTAGDHRPDDAGAVSLLTHFAAAHGLEVGDTIEVTGAAVGAQRLRVSALYENGHLNRSVTLGPVAAEALGIAPVSTGRSGVDRLYVTTEPGSEATAERGLAELFPQRTGFQVHGEETLRAFFVDEWAELNESGTHMFVLVGLFLALGAANAMAVAQFDRGGEFASLRALGVERVRVHLLVAGEITLTLLVVLATAVLVAAGTGAAFALGAPGGGLSLWPELLPVVMTAGPASAVIVLAVLGAQLAVRRTLDRADRDEDRRG